MNGAQQMEQMSRAGFGQDEIDQWAATKRTQLTAAGFSGADVEGYFGKKEPDMEPLRALVKKNLMAGGADEETATAGGTMAEAGAAHGMQVAQAAAVPEFTPAQRTIIERGAAIGKVTGAKPARTFEQALEAGLQMSVTGLMSRGKVPDKVLTDDAPMAARVAANIGTMAGDLPWMTAGALLGGAGGSPSGPGAVMTAGAGAFGLPAGMRATLMDAYTNGDFKDFRDFWTRASGIIWETVKGEVTGAMTAGAGVAAKVALPVVPLAPTAAEITTMVSVGSALEGHVPKAQDFLDAAVVLGGMKVAVGAPRLVEKLRATYAKTGATPQQVMELAAKDPTVLQDLAAENRDVPQVFELPPEHPEYKPSLSDPEYRAELAAMREETGWDQVGGLMIREHSEEGYGVGEVTGRTPWIAKAPWWPERPKGLTEAQSKVAIDKALAGQPLGVREQRLVDYMLDWARKNAVEPARTLDEVERAAIANDLMAASLDYRPSNVRDVDAIARAAQSDADAVERAAVQFPDNRAAFMAVVRRINERTQATDGSAKAAPSGEGGGKTPRELADEQAALDAQASIRELTDAELASAEGGAAAPPAPPGSIGARPAASPQPNPAQQAVLDRVSVGERNRRGYDWNQLYTDAKDELYPIRAFVEELRGDATLSTAKDPYKLARLTRGLAGKADQFLEHSPFKFDTYENVGRGLKHIIEPVKDDLDGLRAYLVAKRALDLDRRGITTGVPADEARAVVRDGERYVQVAREIGQYQDHLLQYAVDAGVISREGAAAMREANRDYVPFFRLMDEEGAKGAGPGLSVRSPVKSIKGSERKIIDPLESIVKNTYLFTAMAERNAVARSLVDLAKGAGREDLVKKVAAPLRPTTVQAEELQRFMDAHGIEGEAEAFTVFRRGFTQLADDEIALFADGKREVYEVPKEVGRAFQGLDHESAGLLTKILAIPARTLRAGATLAPDFMVRNFVRDQLSATILSKNGYMPVIDFVRGMVSVAKADDAFQSWLKSGGANATLMSMDREYLQQRVAEIAELQGTAAKVWNAVKLPVEMLRIGSELVENATRLGEFKKAMGEGGKEAAQAAGFESREVTLDFARIGAKTRAVNMITAFWNAQVEGVDRTVRAFKDDPFATTMRVGAMVTLPSLLLWWANHDDPRWKEIPDWERDLFWIVMTEDHIYRIPKPFELGVIFGSLPERLLDKFVADKPDAMNNLAKSMGKVFGFNTIPTVAAPILEHMTNHSFFTDRPLIPSNLEKLLPEYQYTPYTTEATKALAQIIGSAPGTHASSAASPLVIDNYVRGWTGTLGVYAVQLADAALRKTGVLPDPVLPAATLADMPVIKAFVVRHPSAQAQSIQDFNEHYKESKQVVDTVTYLARQGDVDAAMKESRLDPVQMVKLDGIHTALGNAQRVVQLVYKNPSFSADEKRQLIDNTYMQMIQMAREGEKTLREVKQSLGPRFRKEAEAVH